MINIIKDILQTEFGIKEVEITISDDRTSADYPVKTDTARYIFQTYEYDDITYDRVRAEDEILLSLQENGDLKYPSPVPFADGSYTRILEMHGEKRICRMLSLPEGDPLGNTKYTKGLFRSFGIFLAGMDLSLQKIRNYTIMARQWEGDIQYLDLNRKYIREIPDAGDRNRLNYFFQQFEENVRPLLPRLRKQIIHNQASAENVLTKEGMVTGILGFEDMVWSPLIHELAVAITHTCCHHDDPLAWASLLLSSYHSRLPLEEDEVKVLYYLIAARMVIQACHTDHAGHTHTGTPSVSRHERAALTMLHRWLRINPVKAENTFRKAIGLPVAAPPPVGEVVKRRHRHISPILSISYERPIYMIRSAFQYMYDAYGNTFLDAYNNIPHVGHSHPKVVDAGQRQMARLNTNTRYLYDLLPEYAEKLLSKFPSSLNKVFFVNSGSAASDLAIRMAKIHTGYEKIMVMEHGYHGHTQTATDISDYKFSKPGGQGQKEYIIKTPIPGTFRGKYTQNDGSAGRKYAAEAIAQIKRSDSPVAAFISEPIVGGAGQVPLAKGYLKELYPAIRAQGGLCISDEVQTGFGRLGEYYWGFEMQDVVPDMVVIGKPMANGHPMGALVCTDEIAASFSQGVEFFSSFGGNPVSCAIGLSVLEVMEEEQLQENAKMAGDHYKSLLRELQDKYDCIGDVRGYGLFLGVEMVGGKSREPDTQLARYLKNELRERFILISTDGPYDNVLKSKPPLCFSKENAEEVVEHIDEILKKYYKNNYSEKS